MDLKFILESILFSAQLPLSPKELRDVLVGACEHSEDSGVRAFKKTPFENITAALAELARDHDTGGRSFRLACVAGSWQFVSQPEFAPWIKALVGHKNRPSRLSSPALETLAIIAYRQPITRAEIEQVRGVAVDGVMQTLLERSLVEQTGRAEVVGRPITYGTTPGFLEYFGLKNLDDLPAADELRRIPVQKLEALLTVDPGLATAPPEQLMMPTAASSSPAPNDTAAPVAESSSPAAGETLPPPVAAETQTATTSASAAPTLIAPDTAVAEPAPAEPPTKNRLARRKKTPEPNPNPNPDQNN